MIFSFAVESAALRRPDDTSPIPAIPGFAFSSFPPLVVELAERCLGRVSRCEAVPDLTAMVLISTHGDAETLDGAARLRAAGAKVNPVQFFQSAPTAPLGYVSRKHNLHGALLSLSAAVEDPLESGLSVSSNLLRMGAAQAVLLLGAEPAFSPPTDHPHGRYLQQKDAQPENPSGFALLLSAPAETSGTLNIEYETRTPQYARTERSWMADLISLCETALAVNAPDQSVGPRFGSSSEQLAEPLQLGSLRLRIR